MFGIPGGIEMVIFGLIVVVLFRKQVVEISRPFGQAVGQLRKVKRNIKDEIDSAVNSTHGVGTSREVQVCETSDAAPGSVAALQAEQPAGH